MKIKVYLNQEILFIINLNTAPTATPAAKAVECNHFYNHDPTRFMVHNAMFIKNTKFRFTDAFTFMDLGHLDNLKGYMESREAPVKLYTFQVDEQRQVNVFGAKNFEITVYTLDKTGRLNVSRIAKPILDKLYRAAWLTFLRVTESKGRFFVDVKVHELLEIE